MNGIWIRSQNKMALIIADRIEIMSNKNGQSKIVSWADGVNSYDLLGEYATEQRAVEIIDEIQSFINYEGIMNVFEMPKE